MNTSDEQNTLNAVLLYLIEREGGTVSIDMDWLKRDFSKALVMRYDGDGESVVVSIRDMAPPNYSQQH